MQIIRTFYHLGKPVRVTVCFRLLEGLTNDELEALHESGELGGQLQKMARNVLRLRIQNRRQGVPFLSTSPSDAPTVPRPSKADT